MAAAGPVSRDARDSEYSEELYWQRQPRSGVEITTASARLPAVAPAWTRWGQLVLGIICMVMIANLQYGWTLFIDPIGPRVMVCIGGALVATAWAINSVADSLALFYLAAIITGLGASPIFGATVGNALKWF